MKEIPDMDVGSPPDSDDMNVVYDWWADAQEALRAHWSDGLNVMVGEKGSMAPRYEVREVEKSESVEVMENGCVQLKTKTWTEEEKVPVGEKKVTHGFHMDVVVESEAEKNALVALAHESGLKVRSRDGGMSRFTHRLE